ncbi:MAG: DNA translocase FtsK [Patescibacteria group bacterium]
MAKNKKKIKKPKSPEEQKIKRLILAAILITLAVILFLGLIETAGPLGRYLTHGIKFIFGWSSWSMPLIFLLLAYFILKLKEDEKIKKSVWLGLIIFILALAGLFHLYLIGDQSALKEFRGGGYFGFALVWLLIQFFGFWASLVIMVTLTLISLILISTGFIKEKLPVVEEKPAPVEELQLKSWWQKLREKWQKKKELALKPEKTSEKLVAKPTEELITIQKEAFKPVFKARRLATKIDLPLDLLEISSTKPNSGDIKANKLTIQKTLENFGILVEMGEVKIGPTVTQYTLKPADGVKLSQITSLHNDLALALAAHPIRIEAPIPGQSLVGIEVPNQQIAVVRLREILESEEFKKRKSNLTIGLGKDVAGNIWLADLGKMPHLLVAGATGSGKTVMLNSIIITLLYQNSPDDLKFILVDPKRVELPLYNDLPHLLAPVITDVQKTINALKWALMEMERRFDLMAENKKRDIESFNRDMIEKLPYIVIVIDELADLMVAAPQEMETCIIRLAQMARATGIHLVLATQRPSVDIITGLIKANITSRIAFSVASMTDSRTILDFSGAEKLLGRGDMLFVSPELSKPKRLQGAYVSDQEIKRVVEYLRNIKEPSYQLEILEKQYETEDLGELADDELLSQAREVVIQAGRASASLLQRRLRVGYARAARLLDLLEKEGTIGPADGAKPREVLKKEEN